MILINLNVLNGSYDLRAFTSTLKSQTGEVYQPQYLSPAAYPVIVTTGIEHGGWR